MKFFDFCEVQREAKRIDLGALEEKTKSFFARHPSLKDRKVSFVGLSIDDM